MNMNHEENYSDEKDYEAHREYRRELQNRARQRRRAEQRVRITIVVLLVVCIFGGAFFFKDYRQYLKDYDQFQEYKRYMQALEEENGQSGGETGNVSTPESQPETPGNTDPTGEVVPPETGIAQEPGNILTGSREIADVSGNTLWQANVVSEEAASLIRGYVQERNEVYTWANSYEKTLKINELDKKILAVANCSFPDVKIHFVGDSITEGVGGNTDENGNKIGYVNYVQNALHFGTVTNNGLAGRMIGDYPLHKDLSIGVHESELFNKDAEITVFYAGVNDFLVTEEVKNFGVLDNGTTGGYCGQLQKMVNAFPTNYPGTTFFFVTAYQITATDATPEVTNFDGIPGLNDYMEAQRILAQKNGYPVIDLYNTGFMDMHDAETAANLLSDSIHPNDAGYRILGEHIAAEILLYYLGIN